MPFASECRKFRKFELDSVKLWLSNYKVRPPQEVVLEYCVQFARNTRRVLEHVQPEVEALVAARWPEIAAPMAPGPEKPASEPRPGSESQDFTPAHAVQAAFLRAAANLNKLVEALEPATEAMAELSTLLSYEVESPEIAHTLRENGVGLKPETAWLLATALHSKYIVIERAPLIPEETDQS